jgi:MGT family glycosyltransferase
MHGRHIVLFPLPGVSHVFPFLGLCPELVRRGYRVTVATIEPVAKRVVAAGAEPVIVKTDSYSIPTAMAAIQGLPMDDRKRREELVHIHARWILNSAAMTVRELDSFCKENRPDLFIYELSSYAGRILAKRFHTPAIQYYPDFVQHSGYVCWETSVGYNQPSIAEFSSLLDSFLWAYGFEDPDNFWHTEALNLYQLPKEVQFNSDSLDTNRFCFVGPFLDRPFNPVWKSYKGGKRVILVSAVGGPVGGLIDASYFNKVIAALSGSEYHVILSVGEHFPLSVLSQLPEDFEINRSASHLEILPHTDLHLYSGGPNGTLESLYFGVPLIAIPSYDRNCIIANRLAELGIVRNLPFHLLTSQMLRENVEAVMRDESFLGRTRQMQQVVRSSGGSVMAVDKIEEFLAGRG